MENVSSSTVLRVVFAVNLIVGVFSPLLPAIEHEFGLSAAGVSLLLVMFGLSRLVVDIPAGRLANRYDPLLLLTLSSLAAVVGGVGTLVVPSFPALLLARVLLGVGSALSVVFGLSILARTARRPDAAMSHFYIAMFSALIVSPVLGGLIGGAWGWRVAVASVSVVALVTTLELARRLRSSVRNVQAVRVERSEPAALLVRSAPILTVYWLSFVALVMYTGAKLTLLPLYGASQLGLNVTELGIVFTITSVLTPATMFPIARVVATRTKVNLITLGMIAWLAGLLLLLSPGLASFILASACFDLAGGLMYSTPYALMTDCIPRGAVGQAMGEVRLPADVAWLVTPLLVGIGLDAGGPTLPLVGLIVVSLVTIVVVRGFLSPAALGRARSLLPEPELRET